VLCQKGMDDIAQHYLSKAGILAVDWLQFNKLLVVCQF